MADSTSRLWGKWAGTVTQAGTPTLFGVDQWELKSLGVLVIFRSDGTGTFSEPVGRHDSYGNGTFLYSLRKDTLRIQTIHILDADAKEFEPTTGEGLPSEVYRVKIVGGRLLLKQQGHEVHFVLRRLMGKPKRFGRFA